LSRRDRRGGKRIGKRRSAGDRAQASQPKAIPADPSLVFDLYDKLEGPDFYQSLISRISAHGSSVQVRLIEEIRKGIAEIEVITQRPLLCYFANTINPPPAPSTSLDVTDLLPFAEMVKAAGSGDDVDIWIETPGGDVAVVPQLNDVLRSHFKRVRMFVINRAMSAGTVWACAVDELCMDARGALGPTDPQIPGRDRRLVPMQAVLVLVEEIERRAREAQAAKTPFRVTDQILLRDLDPTALGNAYSVTRYVERLTAEFLEKYKFAQWTTRSDGTLVTPAMRADRAREVAQHLASHDAWKIHRHCIGREVLKAEPLRLKIQDAEAVPGLQNAQRKLWAILHWTFESPDGGMAKLMISKNYGIARRRVVH